MDFYLYYSAGHFNLLCVLVGVNSWFACLDVVVCLYVVDSVAVVIL